MSQSEATPADGASEEQSSDKSLTEQVSAMNERLDALENGQLEDMSDLELVELRTELKQLEDTAENSRKKQADTVLESRIDVGESLYGLKRIQSHKKYLAEEEGPVVMRMVQQGISYTDFVSVNASKLAKEHPDLAEIGKSEYTYLR